MLMVLLAVSAFALDTQRALGYYEGDDKKADVNSAEVRVDSRRKLMALTDTNEYELDLGKGDVVYEGDDEPNCDGDEPACYYDQHTVIRYVQTARGPALEVKRLVVNAFDDEDAGSEEVSTLYWKKLLPNSVSYYYETAMPAAVAEALKVCEKNVEALKSAPLARSVCPRSYAFTMRAPVDEALADLFRVYKWDKRDGDLKSVFDENGYYLRKKVSNSLGLEAEALVIRNQLSAFGEVVKIGQYVNEAAIAVLDRTSNTLIMSYVQTR